MPTVLIAPPLQGPTKGEARIEVSASTLAEAISAVEAEHRGFRRQIVDEEGKIRKFITLFVNGSLVSGADLSATVRGNDEVEILAALAGG